MTLPKIDVPIYELQLPSSKKSVRVRPFLVKEEKLLLIAVESKDQNTIIQTTKQIINNCLIDGDVNIDKLPFFDVDYLFIALRAKSIGETVTVNFICNMFTDGNKCGAKFPVDIDIGKCEVKQKEDVSSTIKITDKVTIKMKYPGYEVMKRFMENEDAMSKKIKIMAASIDQIIDGSKILSSKDYSREELEKYIETFTEEQYKKLDQFVDNFPSFVILAEGKCPKCKFHHKLEYTDFTSFFT
jgi:hypothetical protein